MFLSCYLRKGILYVPTFAKLDTGAYMSIEPVAVVPVSETADLRRALADTMARGNPILPSPTRDNYPPPVVLKHAGLKSYASFERGTRVWHIVRRGGVYRIKGQQRRPGGGWVDDPDQVVEFPPSSTADEVIERLIAILQAKAQES